mmetsp:Transcript_16688/g.49907  ORF Transcript_16688/g.49907 Transcript_16688/m.49907 type:complete len:237 (-) Transcript_16688:834-1544(-)
MCRTGACGGGASPCAHAWQPARPAPVTARPRCCLARPPRRSAPDGGCLRRAAALPCTLRRSCSTPVASAAASAVAAVGRAALRTDQAAMAARGRCGRRPAEPPRAAGSCPPRWTRKLRSTRPLRPRLTAGCWRRCRAARSPLRQPQSRRRTASMSATRRGAGATRRACARQRWRLRSAPSRWMLRVPSATRCGVWQRGGLHCWRTARAQRCAWQRARLTMPPRRCAWTRRTTSRTT